MVKILNLNIWNYNHFKERKPKIIRLIKKQNPDIVILQEVTDDLKFNKKGEDQAKQLNKKLRYPYCVVYLPTNMQKETPDRFGDRRSYEGSAILSKYPILAVTRQKLKKQKEDRHTRGNLYAKIKIGEIFEIMAVHFSNRDLLASLHLIETLDYIKRKGINPIIIGDFNIRKTKQLIKLTKTSYKISYLHKKYISYPSKKETLDYILIPKNLRFESLKCLKDKVSDHRALVASIA